MSHSPGVKTRILVVEDDVTVRDTISQMLEEEGYAVTTAYDGFDALLRLQSETPDLILSDLNMPQMSGFELLSIVRQRFPKVLVLASSGAYLSSAVPHGVLADAFYAKGQESAETLLKIIAKLLLDGPISHKGECAPVWIPRNGKDHDGKPFVVLTCTHCLRSFPFVVEHEPTGDVLKTPCIYCPNEVTYIIDFSRSVSSPGKTAAWKAAFLMSQADSPSSTLLRVKTEMAEPRIVKSARSRKAKVQAPTPSESKPRTDKPEIDREQ